MTRFFAGPADHTATQPCICCPSLSRRSFLRSTAAVAGATALPAGAFAQGASAPATMDRIDTHHHFYPPGVKKLGGLGGPLTDNWTPQTALDEMEKGGVKTAILSLASAPMPWFKLPDSESRGFVREINEYGAKMVADHPGRFGLFAFLSMVDVDGTLKEIEYAFDKLKADGVGIATGYGDIYPGNPKFTAIFDELNRRKATVYFHPTTQNCCMGAVTGLSDSLIEVPHDTSRAVMSLLMSGNMPKWRDIKFLWSHGGGTIPMLADRIAWLITKTMRGTEKLIPDGPVAEFKRFYYDTANAGYGAPMSALLKLVPPEQIVFGTDYPYVSTDWNAKALRTTGLSDAQIRGIETQNAKVLIPRLKA